MRSWFLCCWIWAALCGCTLEWVEFDRQISPSFVPLTHPLPMHHLQSWAAVTSWVFPREGWDKHETSLQPYQRVWNKSWDTFESESGGNCSPGQSSGWALLSGVGDRPNRQETAISSMKISGLSPHLLWANLIFLIGATWRSGWTHFFLFSQKLYARSHLILILFLFTLIHIRVNSEVKVFIKQNIILYSWRDTHCRIKP